MQTETILDLPRVRARERTLSATILVVDDDELSLSLMADRLRAVGFKVATAHNGEEALKLLDAEWYPVVLADWQMPVMTGISLVRELRARGNDESYFIMLSIRAEQTDFEQGYGAGADDYLSKKSPDVELLARIEAGMNTVSLRRALREARNEALTHNKLTHSKQSMTADNNNVSNNEIMSRLRMELTRARRYRRVCSLMLIGVDTLLSETRDELLQAVRGLIRLDIDSADWLIDDSGATRIAVVLPETGPAEVAVIRRRLCGGLAQRLNSQTRDQVIKQVIKISIGAASVDGASVATTSTADDLVRVAEHCRSCMAGDGHGHLTAVQASVVSQFAIPCRQGYAVADHCLELALKNKEQRPVVNSKIRKGKTEKTKLDKDLLVVDNLSNVP